MLYDGTERRQRRGKTQPVIEPKSFSEAVGAFSKPASQLALLNVLYSFAQTYNVGLKGYELTNTDWHALAFAETLNVLVALTAPLDSCGWSFFKRNVKNAVFPLFGALGSVLAAAGVHIASLGDIKAATKIDFSAAFIIDVLSKAVDVYTDEKVRDIVEIVGSGLCGAAVVGGFDFEIDWMLWLGVLGALLKVGNTIVSQKVGQNSSGFFGRTATPPTVTSPLLINIEEDFSADGKTPVDLSGDLSHVQDIDAEEGQTWYQRLGTYVSSFTY